MAEYKINWIDDQPPKKWDNPKGGIIYYTNVMVDNHPKPVSVGKKAPYSLKVGDTITGDIIPKDGFDTDNFKAAPAPGFGSKVDSSEERAKWAIGLAFSDLAFNRDGDLTILESRARQLYAMVDRVISSTSEVRASGSSTSQPGYEQAKAAVQNLNQRMQTPAVPVTTDYGDGPF